MDRLVIEWTPLLLEGAAMTVGLALATLPFGLALGLLAALAKDSRHPFPRALGETYTTLFRALPELLTLLLIYYGAQILSQNLAAATGLPLALNLSPFWAGVAALSLVFGAYTSEVLLAALHGIDQGQIEAARSFGMPPRLAFRRIIAPQMLRMALPGLGNNWLSLLKDTSLVSVIALNDLLRMSSIAVERTRRPFEFYAAACLIYLALTALSALVLARAEKAAGRGWKRPA